MIDTLMVLIRSKKFLALIGGGLVWVLAKVGLDLDSNDVTGLLVLVSSYIIGQGVADNGKEAEKIKSELGSDEYDDDVTVVE